MRDCFGSTLDRLVPQVQGDNWAEVATVSNGPFAHATPAAAGSPLEFLKGREGGGGSGKQEVVEELL